MRSLLVILFIGFAVFGDRQVLGYPRERVEEGHPIHPDQALRVRQTRQICGLCRNDYRPVCGLDFSKGYQTFANTCDFESENRCRRGRFQHIHNGACNVQEDNFRIVSLGRPILQ